MPTQIGAKTPLCSPCQDKLVGGEQLPSAPMTAKSATWISFYWLACADAALVDTKRLANLKATLQDIAIAISKRQFIQYKWAIAYLPRHLDYLEGALCTLEDLAYHLNHVMTQPGTQCPVSRPLCPVSPATTKVQGCWGVSLTRTRATGTQFVKQAASPSNPQRSMGGSIEGSIAPSPTMQGVVTPSTSLACPPLLACPRTQHCHQLPLHHQQQEGGPLRRNTAPP